MIRMSSIPLRFGRDEESDTTVSNAAAAYELGITETTARQHLSGLYRRTGCLNAAQAAYLLGSGAYGS